MTIEAIVNKYGGLNKEELRRDVEALVDDVISSCVANAKTKDYQIPDRFGHYIDTRVDTNSILQTKKQFGL